MNFETMKNCTENGKILSCFLTMGEVESVVACADSKNARLTSVENRRWLYQSG